MPMYPWLTRAAETRQVFEEQILKLFFELEAEHAANPSFALPDWMAPTFVATKQSYDAWDQAVTARGVGATLQEGTNR